MAAIAPRTLAPATNFRCETRGFVARFSRTLILLLLLSFSKLEPNYFSRDAASSQLSRQVRGRPWAAHPKVCALQQRRLAAASELRNETLPQAAQQIRADARPDPRHARIECPPAKCPGNRQLLDKCLPAACAG